MEIPTNEEIQESLLDKPSDRAKGGCRTLPFIIANEAFERLASQGLQANMIMYLTGEYGMGSAQGSNVLFLWTSASSIASVIGAYIADSFTGRFRMIGFGCIISLLGMAFLWLTTFLPHSGSTCDQISSCKPPKFSEFVLYFSFALMTIGAGGIDSCSLSFGADQLNKGGNLKNKRTLESYFSWYYVSVVASIIVAMTCIVYIQDHLGWRVGFGIPVLLMFLSALVFFLSSPLYVKTTVESSLFTRYAQVLVASYKNRKLEGSPQVGEKLCHSRKGSELITPSEKLRFLNKACIVRNPENDLTPGGQVVDRWSLCTIEDVEEVKSIIRIVPLWSTGILSSVNPGSLVTIMVASMNRHITSNFEMPAASFGTFMFIFIIIWISLYDRIILPTASRFIGRPAYLSPKQKMGIGNLCSFGSIASLAAVESARRKIAIQEQRSISAMWLMPYYIFAGLTVAFATIGQNEFYYSELPKSMSSIALNLVGVSMSLANLFSSLILTTVDDITKNAGKHSWITDNINEGHYDYYFWLLAALGLLNFIYFLACSNAHGPCRDDGATKNVEEDIE